MRIGILLSGGTGSRIKSDIPKQYIEVGGKPIISYSLETLYKCVDRLQIVVAPEWKEFVQAECDKLAIKEVAFSVPGLTRQFSVYNALKDAEGYAIEDTSVIIHDAARPNVSIETIEHCFSAIAEGHDGALPVVKVNDTVYFSMDGNEITSLLDRTKLYAGQAPEAFDFKKYLLANERLVTRMWQAGGEYIVSPASEIFKITGSTEPARLAGLDVVMVEGDDHNYKITTDADLSRFKSEIESGN